MKVNFVEVVMNPIGIDVVGGIYYIVCNKKIFQNEVSRNLFVKWWSKKKTFWHLTSRTLGLNLHLYPRCKWRLVLICYLLSQLLAIRALEALFDLCVGAANQGGIVLRATAQMKPFWALSVVARDQISQQPRIRTLGAVSTRQQIHGVGRGTTHS